MTELEKRLSMALRELSAQYEREQRSAGEQIAGLSGQVTTLRERVEQLQLAGERLGRRLRQARRGLQANRERVGQALEALRRRSMLWRPSPGWAPQREEPDRGPSR